MALMASSMSGRSGFVSARSISANVSEDAGLLDQRLGEQL
jgi:hypothetical protein